MVRFANPVSADARKVLGTDDDPTAPTPPPATALPPAPPPGMANHSDVPFERRTVDSMPLVIQRGFRFKMLGLLTMQLFFIFVSSVILVKTGVTVKQDTFTLCFL